MKKIICLALAKCFIIFTGLLKPSLVTLLFLAPGSMYVYSLKGASQQLFCGSLFGIRKAICCSLATFQKPLNTNATGINEVSENS
jgi:hypothetical protein